MPIEIRELVIRASVAEAAGKERRLEAALDSMKKEVLQQCLEQLRDYLARSTQR